MAALEVIEAIVLLEPLVEKLAGYIVGRHDDLPEVPGVLKSDIELARLKLRVGKRQNT